MDYYQTLGIERSATPEEIKKAYRKMANQHHPDKGGDVKKFQDVQKAYDTLSDPQKRVNYDMGSASENIHININDPFSFFNFGHNFRRHAPIFTITLVVSLEQVAKGTTETVKVNTHTGVHLVQIQIPAGVEDGMQYRFQKVIPDGDLNVIFKIRPDDRFTRHGFDLVSESKIDFFKLITGTTIKITDIYGSSLDISVPPMTKPGTKLRIAGRGLPTQFGKGDQYVLIQGTLPDKISDRLKQTILEELKEKINDH